VKLDPTFNWKLFPNPALDQVTLQCEGCQLENIRITNLMGQVSLEKRVEVSQSLPIHLSVQHLPTGVYFMSGYTTSGLLYQTEKFVKK